MADLGGGSSPPTYDEAIHDHQFDIGGPSSEQTATSQIDKEPEKPHSHGPMEPLARGSTAPSAPPLSEIADQVDEPEAPQHPTPTTRSEVPSHTPTDHDQQTTKSKNASKTSRLFKCYIGYSVAQNLRIFIEPEQDQPDPDLDYVPPSTLASVKKATEHREKLQCVSGWFWFFGGLQVAFYIGLPIAMLITGIVSIDHNKCPYDSEKIPTYLLIGGTLLLFVTIFRILPSSLTCCMNRNICKSKDSICLLILVGVFESVFYIFLVVNLAILITGTVWIFDSTPPYCKSLNSTIIFPPVNTINMSNTDSIDGRAVECCEKPVYNASAVFNIFQYILHGFSVAYLLVTGACIKWMATYT